MLNQEEAHEWARGWSPWISLQEKASSHESSRLQVQQDAKEGPISSIAQESS